MYYVYPSIIASYNRSFDEGESVIYEGLPMKHCPTPGVHFLITNNWKNHVAFQPRLLQAGRKF